MRKQLLGIALILGLAYATEITHNCDELKWKCSKVKTENVNGVSRANALYNQEKGSSSYGCSIKSIPAPKYIQINVPEVETPTMSARLSNASSGGGFIGNIYLGYNTFATPAHLKNSFYFRLDIGNRKPKQAPEGYWIGLKNISISDSIPANAPVVELVSGTELRVSSVLKVTFKPTQDAGSDTIPLKFAIAPTFTTYTFDGENDYQLTKDGEVYTATITVTDKAIGYKSDKNSSLQAIATINGMPYRYTIPFNANIETNRKIDASVLRSETPHTREMRELWFKLTKGTNLALGKTYQLVPTPDYHLTKKGDTDLRDLTDGKLTPSSNDRLWFNKECVGWYNGPGHSFIKIDLGEVAPVDKIVIRLLGGSNGNFKFPRAMTAHASKDGKYFHTAGTLQKLAPGEKEQCDWKRYYYLEENLHWGNAWTYPLMVSVNAEARYLILEIEAESGSIFSDEMVVLKAEKRDAFFNEAYKATGYEIPMAGLIVRPRVAELAVIDTLPAPQKLEFTDIRSAEEKKGDFGKLAIILPKGVSIINDADYTKEAQQDGSTKYIYDLAKTKGRSPVFFVKADLQTKGNATFYAITKAGEQFKTTVPVKVVPAPNCHKPKRMHISLSWMGENAGRNWPDFWTNWERLGFNVVGTFPRYWWNDAAVKHGQEYVDAAHAHGYPVIMNDSAFHEMVRNKKPGHEMYCQIPGKENSWLCPSYRGDFYQKEMERVQRCTKNGKPDFVFYDIEIWNDAFYSSSQCTRCQEAIKASGLSQREYLYKCGKEMMADLKAAIARGAEEAGIKMPVIGSYGRHAGSPTSTIERWDDTFPSSLDLSEPSLYVCGRALDVHDCIRKNYQILGKKLTIPWLTAGTYGEFESYKIEQMVLEAMLNGAMGVTYFCESNFYDSPLDFYYHAKAVEALLPYEDLVMDGIPTDISGDNAGLTYSMLLKDNEALILVGNYKGAAPKVTLSLPFKPSAAKDARAGKELKCTGTSMTIDVPKNKIMLLYIKK